MAAATLTGVVGAAGDDRTIWMYHIHTKETIQVLYKKNGRYIPEALKKLNWFLRDWRRDEATKMDPRTIDIVWEMHAELGSQKPVHIISGYRSRNTNEMLRKTRGGQASQSQHITGKAIDIHFPDVPVRRLRYSAMIRERGGVGYYPTSALPFVHVDTARVRSWPRLPHDELALLFPSGRSKHLSAEGRSLEPGDASAARRRKPQLARQVAEYFDIRATPRKAVLVASADGAPLPVPPAPKPAVRPAPSPQPEKQATVLAALPPPPMPRPVPPAQAPATTAEPAPRLVREPRLVERSSKFTQGPSAADRRKLEDLVWQATITSPQAEPKAQPVLAALAPSPAGRPATPPAAETQPDLPDKAVAELEADSGLAGRETTTWIAAPAYDDDHPEELAYQPFPILPLLTNTPSPDDPALARMLHPDVARTLDMLDDEGRILPMRIRPGAQLAQLLLAKEFRGQAVDLSDIETRRDRELDGQTGVAERVVRTSPR